jgi:hypothetical protein
MGIGFGGGAMRWLGMLWGSGADPSPLWGWWRAAADTRSLDCVSVRFADAHFARDDNDEEKSTPMVTKVRREGAFGLGGGVCLLY